MSEFNAAFDMPRTPMEALQVLQAWAQPSNMTYSGDKVRAIARILEPALEESESAQWIENVEYLLKRCPHTIRSREGGGPENLLHSLIITFMGMEIKLEEARRANQER